jgi:CBS domain-containing protein
MLDYSDMVALLYRYCRGCAKGAVPRSKRPDHSDRTQLLTVRDAMEKPVISCAQEDPLARVIEEVIAHRLGAVLIVDGRGRPAGVISKTDIVLAYRHGTSLEAPAGFIMHAPVASCDELSPLSGAIRHMFLKDVQRLFAYAGDPSHIVGVLSLSDAAQIRSGSCRACVASRVITAP